MQIVSEVGSPEYYELRAIEEVQAARYHRQCIETDRKFDGNAHSDARYHEHITKAIQLIVLAGLNYGTSQGD